MLFRQNTFRAGLEAGLVARAPSWQNCQERRGEGWSRRGAWVEGLVAWCSTHLRRVQAFLATYGRVWGRQRTLRGRTNQKERKHDQRRHEQREAPG